MELEYSFVVPVYNRPREIEELLQSMQQLDFQAPFEIVIVEDGSTKPAKEVVKQFSKTLQISYYYKQNSGPGDSRNYGMKKAKGNYYLILDSDVLLPSNYLKEVDVFLKQEFCDCFGGPDAAHDSFSPRQKAIDYAMTSFLTTGGIRGQKSMVTKFEPRSFNMGLSKQAFEASAGFGNIHPGEDPDLSLRLQKMGFQTCLIPQAKVYHKRRINWNKFYRQVNKFGLVRPILNLWHPGSGKITYWFPTIFIGGFIISTLILSLNFWWFFVLYLIYFLLIGIDAAKKYKSITIGLHAIYAVMVQFAGYGYGYIVSIWQIKLLNKSPEEAFPQLFFKNV